MSFLRNRTTEDELFVEFQVERVTQSTRQAVARYASAQISWTYSQYHCVETERG